MTPRQTMHHGCQTVDRSARRPLVGALLALAGLACGGFAGFQPARVDDPTRDPVPLEQVTQDRVPGPAGAVGEGDDPEITFSETAEPMELTALVDFVAQTLGINLRPSSFSRQ